MSFILSIRENKLKTLLFSYCVLFSLFLPYLLYTKKAVLAVLMAPIALLFLLDNFEHYLKPALMYTMFVYFYLDATYRIQLINLFSYMLIVYYLINFDKSTFNKLALPLWIKISSGLLIVAVFISSVNSPYASIQSYYYALMFFIYIYTGYIIYKTILKLEHIDDYLKYFVSACSLYAVFIIISIVMTGNLRARGITGSAFSDIIVCSLLVVIFKNLFFEGQKLLHVIMAVLLLIVLVTDQSRFAWLGFMLSFAYGLIVILKYQKSKFIRRRIVFLFAGIIFGIFLIFVTGLYSVIMERLKDVSFSILTASEDKEIVANSLDTRGLIWLTALSTFANHPVTGVGYFMFHIVSENYNVLPEFLYQEFVKGVDAHTTFFNILCETGLIGFTCFITLYIVIFVLSIKSIKLSRIPSDLRRSLILNILVFFIESTCIYSGAYTFGYNAYFLYFVFALVIANYVFLKKKQNGEYPADIPELTGS